MLHHLADTTIQVANLVKNITASLKRMAVINREQSCYCSQPIKRLPSLSKGYNSVKLSDTV